MATDVIYYILDAHGRPMPAAGLYEWAEWSGAHFKEHEVGRTQLSEEILISTIFLGLDHNWDDKGPPILWETMVFRKGAGEEYERCAGNREQAEAMHAQMIRRIEIEMRGKKPKNSAK